MRFPDSWTALDAAALKVFLVALVVVLVLILVGTALPS